MSLYRFFAGVNSDNPPDARATANAQAFAARRRIGLLEFGVIVCASTSAGLMLGALAMATGAWR